jgi:hypothetical protein
MAYTKQPDWITKAAGLASGAWKLPGQIYSGMKSFGSRNVGKKQATVNQDAVNSVFTQANAQGAGSFTKVPTPSQSPITRTGVQTASSVVDFLGSRGFAPAKGERLPLFDTRKGLYEQAGLNTTLGDFTGSSAQNTALLSFLQKQERDSGVSINQSNINDVVKLGAPVQTSLTEGTPAPDENGIITFGDGSQLDTNTGQVIAQQGGAAVEGNVVDETGGTTDMTGMDASGLFGDATPSNLAQLALDEVTSSAKFPLQQEANEAEKADLRVQAQADREKLISTLASKGLYFSGKKNQGLQGIDAEEVAKTLGVDRKFALLIASGLDTAAQRIAKEAQQGNQDAIKSLEALGWAINPLTGQVEPTLAAKKAEEQALQFQEREYRMLSQFEAQQELRDAQYELNLARTSEQIRQADERIAISTLQLALAQERESRLSAGGGGGSRVDARQYREDLANAIENIENKGSREEAISTITNNAGSIAVRLGQEGTQKILEAIDNKWPPPKPIPSSQVQVPELNKLEQWMLDIFGG